MCSSIGLWGFLGVTNQVGSQRGHSNVDFSSIEMFFYVLKKQGFECTYAANASHMTNVQRVTNKFGSESLTDQLISDLFVSLNASFRSVCLIYDVSSKLDHSFIDGTS